MKPCSRAVLLANGELFDEAYARSLLQPDDLLVAVNGGSYLAWRLGMIPDLLVGDNDSLLPEISAWLAGHHVPSHLHPVEKDATDLELALAHVLSLQPSSLLFLGLTGRRVDHTIANFSAVSAAADKVEQIEVVSGREHLYYVKHALHLSGQLGETVSLLPWGGDAHGVRTEGLQWQLAGETLRFGSARGISNVMVAEQASVLLTEGLLLVSHHRGEKG